VDCASGHRSPVSGHCLSIANRKEICDRYGIDYAVRELSLPDRDAAADWIDAHQLGRWNLTPAQMSLTRGRRYNRAKGQHGGDRRGGVSRAQGDPLKTADRLAREHGVSPPTIKRDGQYAEAVDRLGIQQKVASGQVTASWQDVVEAARSLGDALTTETSQRREHTHRGARYQKCQKPPSATLLALLTPRAPARIKISDSKINCA